jgi:ABC-2 type transport system ATP-binding protein
MIRLEHVSKSFAAIHAVKDVSLAIKKGAITIVSGADGAGKSTIFKMLVGLIKKDAGDIFLNGENINNDYARITSVCGYMPEKFSLYVDLSVEENLNFFADIQKVPRRRREELKQRLLEKTGMLPFKKRRTGALSGGMKQKLALSAILLSSPELIILDEPTTGVDPLSRIEFFAIIEDLKKEGKTIVMSTPYLDEAEKGDFVVLLKNGRVMVQDSIAMLRKSFPARLFRIRPRANIFEVMQQIKDVPGLGGQVHMRGKFIRYMQKGPENLSGLVPHLEILEETPTLEDIYIYHERQQ